jgi:hypothetical protein
VPEHELEQRITWVEQLLGLEPQPDASADERMDRIEDALIPPLAAAIFGRVDGVRWP